MPEIIVSRPPVAMSSFARGVMQERYAHEGEEWGDIARRVVTNVLAVLAPGALLPFPINAFELGDLRRELVELVESRKFIPGGRYLASAGLPYHQTQNCLLLRADDSREGWANLMRKVVLGSMTGAGEGVLYSAIRPAGAKLARTGGVASGPLPLAQAVNEIGRSSKQGGKRRVALWGGLHWWHDNIREWITAKDWSPEVRALKAKDFNFPAPLDHTNISVCLDSEFFIAYYSLEHPRHLLARDVYWSVVRRMLETGEPGFSVDVGANEGECLRNACTEVTSRDDSDICNLGSLNLARITLLKEMERAVELATLFLLAGTLYSDVPYPEVDQVRKANRRLGLGLMGLHEFLLKNGACYGEDPQLTPYLEVYARSGEYARRWARRLDISAPVKTRAIAPTGTIGAVAETTTGIEPIFCTAYQRRRLRGGDQWASEYVIDPTAERLVRAGHLPEEIEDAYSINPERRVAFQAYVQQYVDHGISSTINLPKWGTSGNNEDSVRPFGEMLLRYLPTLRGITCYPDGARSGQPLVPVSFAFALQRRGDVILEQGDTCDLSKGASCGA